MDRHDSEMSGGLRERHRQRTRIELIDAAIALCQQLGFEQATVDLICARVDLSPRTFARYFPTKDAVILAVLVDMSNECARELADVPADRSPFEALLEAHQIALRRVPDGVGVADPRRLTAAIDIIAHSPTLRAQVAAFRDDTMTEAIAKRMGRTTVDRQVLVTTAVWYTIVVSACSNPALWLTADHSPEEVGDLIAARIADTYVDFAALVHDPTR